MTLLALVFAPSPASGDEPLPPLPSSSVAPPLQARVTPSSRPPLAATAAPAALTLTPPAPRGRGAWRAFRAGADLAHSIPTAAIIDGAWSISLQLNTTLTTRTWDAPYPYGTIGQYSTRILYGMSWTAMLGLESLVVVLAMGGTLDWIGEASYRSDWVLPVDLPACPSIGAWGGCGLGVGSFSFIQIRPRGSRWWYEAGGGWFQQRVLNDAFRTVAESSWVLTPLSALREVRTNPDADVAFRLFAGPGLYFGMNAAHMHPTRLGTEVHRDVPWTEMYPLGAGIGPGARVEGRMIIGRHLSIEGEVVVAPFLLGGPASHVPRDVAPLDFDREGMTVWRKVGLGIGWEDPANIPFKPTLSFFGAELSERSLDRIGYRGGMIRFDIPLRVPRDD